jgi:hypothetical protein
LGSIPDLAGRGRTKLVKRFFIESGFCQSEIAHPPNDLVRELDSKAKKSHLTKTEVARRRPIAASSQSHESDSGFDLIPDRIGTIEGGPGDVSARKTEYLKTKCYGKPRHR